jgi:hypothetical protein
VSGLEDADLGTPRDAVSGRERRRDGLVARQRTVGVPDRQHRPVDHHA